MEFGAGVFSWHFSEVPPAASEGRSWLHSGLQQTARGRVYEFTPQSLNANPLRIPAPSTLLLSILRRMRQLALMLENLAQIAAIDPATAGRASHAAIRLCHLDRLANLRFDRPADIFPARDCRSIGCH